MNKENKSLSGFDKSMRYTKYEDIVQRMRNEIKTCIVMRISYLSGERELSERFATSRNTLRKALGTLEAEGLIICDGHRKRIPQVYSNIAEIGSVVFFAAGDDNMFTLPAVERLWNSLQPLLLHRRAKLSLCLDGKNTRIEQIREILEPATVIICAAPSKAGMELLASLKNKIVIDTVAVAGSTFKNVVMLDNHAVGRIAAETLLSTGCKKVFAMWENCYGNTAMPCRAEGFIEGLREHGLGGIESIVWVKRINNSVINEMKQQLSWSIEHGYDGVFLMSDELIGDVLGEQISKGTIPSLMRVVTVDGTGAGRRHQPSIATISHASETVAVEIYDQLCLVADKHFKGVQKLIRPVLYPGGLDQKK